MAHWFYVWSCLVFGENKLYLHRVSHRASISKDEMFNLSILFFGMRERHCHLHTYIVLFNNSLKDLPKQVLWISWFSIFFFMLRQSPQRMSLVSKDSNISWPKKARDGWNCRLQWIPGACTLTHVVIIFRVILLQGIPC